MIHRDVKPANIMLSADGTTKLGSSPTCAAGRVLVGPRAILAEGSVQIRLVVSDPKG